MIIRETRALLRHPAGLGAMTGAVVLGALVALGPTVLVGEDEVLGDPVRLGMRAGALLALALGPVLAAVSAVNDHEGAMRQVRMLAGSGPARQAAEQVVVLGVCCFVVTVVTTASSCLATLGDLAVRRLTGAGTVTPPTVDSSWAECSALLGAWSASVLVLLLGLILMSGVRAAVTVTVVLASWPVLLLATVGVEDREWLVLHPVAGAWRLFVPELSDVLTLEASVGRSLASAIAWAAVIASTACVAVRKP